MPRRLLALVCASVQISKSKTLNRKDAMCNQVGRWSLLLALALCWTNNSARGHVTSPPSDALEQTFRLSDLVRRGCRISANGEQTYVARVEVGGRDDSGNMTIYSVPLEGDDRGTNKFKLDAFVCGAAWRVAWVPTETDDRFTMNGTAEPSAFSFGGDVAIHLDVRAKQVIRRVVRSPSDSVGMAIEPPSVLLADHWSRSPADAWRWHRGAFSSPNRLDPPSFQGEAFANWSVAGTGAEKHWVWTERVKRPGVTSQGKPLDLVREIHFTASEPYLPVRFRHYSQREGDPAPLTVYGDWAVSWSKADHNTRYAVNGHVLEEIRNRATALDKEGRTIDRLSARYTDLRLASVDCDPANASAPPIEAPPEWEVIDLDESGFPVGVDRSMHSSASPKQSLWILSICLAAATTVGLILLRNASGR